VSWVFGYFAFSLFNPVLFHYHGPVVAGQMGMTWTLTTGLQAFAMAWLQPKIPLFGMLIAKKDYAALDRAFFRSSATALVITALGAAVLWSAVAGLYLIEHPLARRMLPPLPTGLFVLAVMLMQVASCQSAYLRAHKKEPLVVVSAVFGLAVGVLVWLLGSRSGALGAAIGYLCAVVLAVVWETAIWLRYRAEWHRA
jgi:O-antigen/teichoic acid export membrane protein